jgi:hypothetical protein
MNDEPTAIGRKDITTAWFVQRGMPAPNHTWSLDEYKQADTALAGITKEGRARLPRRKSAGEMFDRLVATDAFDVLRDERQSVQDRIRIGIVYVGIVVDLAEFYARAVPPPAFDQEEVELSVQLLRLEGLMATLMRDFETKEGRNLSEENRQRSRKQHAVVIEKVGASVARTLDMLSNPNAIDPDAREDCIRRLAEFMPALVKEIPESARADIRIRILEMKHTEKNATIHASVAALSDALQRDRGTGK